MKPKDYKNIEKQMADCIGDMREPLPALANKYPNHVINGSMLELALRMILMSEGSLTTLHMLGATVANLVEKGAMIEAYMKSDNELDESDWLKNGSLVKPTIH